MHVQTVGPRAGVAPHAVAIALAALLALALDGAPALALALIAASAAAVVDARSGRLPDPLVVATAAPAIAIALAASAVGSPAAALSVLLGALAMGGPVTAVHLIAPAAMGFGDVKFGAALGGACGLIAPSVGIVALCLAAGVTVAIGLGASRRAVPFGPGLALGAAVACVAALWSGVQVVTWR